ncbi:MAG: dTDP-4-dehydrorhamnose 3,5-epimerase [Alphaproteobacteria bacterium]|nr:dTDP-4-dehydrorhamnose 3,5-epimerase [Alphaproteobacteria bacterium]
MRIIQTALPEVLIFEPKSFSDSRGVFFESWRDESYAAAGVSENFVQDNVSSSSKGTLRGLHFQEPNGQGKLVMALAGAVFDVAVDIRRGSPRFGQWCGVELSAENRQQLWIPPGFAHGFQALQDNTVFHYKCTAYYSPSDEGAIRWDDPEIGIDWPIQPPLLSDKDRTPPLLRDAPVLPVYASPDP